MPRTLAQNATYINETIKPAIKSAIEAQGVTVPSTDSFLDYADRIGEIEGGGSGYQLKDLPTGSISTVSDAEPLPLNALTVSVEAWQEGTGDPSPSNVRPIHGWDSGNIVDLSDTTNKEYFDGLLQGKYGFINLGSLTWRYNSDYSMFYSDAINTMLSVDVNTIYSMVVNGYAVHSDNEVFDGHGSPQIDKAIWSVEKTVRISDSRYNRGADLKASLDGVYLVYELATAVTPSITEADFSTVLKSFDINGWFRQADFPTTIYGAEWDVVGGVLKQTDGYIVFDGSSDEGWGLENGGKRVYSGMLRGIAQGSAQGIADITSNQFKATTSARTLAGNEGISIDGSGWLCVADGTGAMSVADWNTYLSEHPLQVRYKLITPTTIPLSPLSIRLLEGTNNIYADCGEVIEGEYFSGDNQLYANGIIFAGEGDSGIGSYRKIDTLPTALLNATAMTCEVCARFDSFVNLSSGPYARIITFGDDNQTGRFGPVGLVYDGSSSYDLCVWDDTVDISSGLCVWTPTDTHTVAVVKTTAGVVKIYVDGVLKYTGSSALTITNTLIDYITQRARTNTPSDTQRQINGEVYAWRIYGKELSASQINANFLVDKINYID